MTLIAALIYWVIVAIWLTVLFTVAISYRRNKKIFGVTRMLLAVVAIDTTRNIVENSYFGLYFGSQYGLLPPLFDHVLGQPILLLIPKTLNILAGCTVLSILLLRWLPAAAEERLVSEERQATLGRLACIDGLTGLFNRRHFLTLATAEDDRSRRHDRPVSILMIDIDRFKLVNDAYGHDVGDRVIVAVAKVCQDHARISDIAARLGGEEFVLLLPETGLHQASIVAERMRAAIADTPIRVAEHTLQVTISIGVAASVEDHSIHELLKHADLALYDAKHGGRNRVCQRGIAPKMAGVPLNEARQI